MSALRELYMTKGQGFILVYSVTEVDSLKVLLGIRDAISRAKDGANVRDAQQAHASHLARAVPHGGRGQQVRSS